MKINPQNIFNIIKGKPNFNLYDPEERQKAIEYAFSVYYKTWQETKNSDLAFEKLQPMIEEFNKARYKPVDILRYVVNNNKDDKQLALKLAKRLCEMGADDEDAINLYKQALQESDKPIPFYIALECYFRKKDDIQNLAITYEQFYHLYQSWLKFEEERGMIPIDEEDLNKASSLFERAIKELSRIFIETNRKDFNIMPIIERAYHLNPTNLDLITHLAESYCDMKKKDADAIKIYEQYIKFGKDISKVQEFLADYYLEIKQNQKGSYLLKELYDIEKDAQRKKNILNKIVNNIFTFENVTSVNVNYLIDYLENNPKNLGVMNILVKYFSNEKDLSAQAVEVYKKRAQMEDAPEDILLLLGKNAFQHKNWKEVIEIYEKFDQSAINDSDSVFPLSVAYSEFDRTDAKAIEVYEKAVDANTANNNIYKLLCEYYFNTKSTSPKALKCFKNTLIKNKDFATAYIGICQYQFITEQYEYCFKECMNLLEIHPSNENGIYFAAQSLVKFSGDKLLKSLNKLSNNDKKAILEKAYSLNQDVLFAQELAEIYINQRDLKPNEEKILELAAETSPSKITILEILSNKAREKSKWKNGFDWDVKLIQELDKIENKQGNYAKVFADACTRVTNLILERELKIPPEIPDILQKTYKLGNRSDLLILKLATDRLLSRDTSEESMNYYLSALEIEPENMSLQIQLQYCYLNIKKYKEVVSFCADYIKNNIEWVSKEIIMILKQGLLNSDFVPDGLAENLEILRQKNTENTEIISCLAHIYGMQKKYNENSAEIFKHAIYFDHDNKSLYIHLANSYLATDEIDNAIKLYKKSLKDSPENPELLNNLSTCYLKLGDHSKKVLELAEKAAKLNPNDFQAQINLAKIYHLRGLDRRSVDLIDEIHEQFPQAQEQLLALLEEMDGKSKTLEDNNRITLKIGQFHLKNGETDLALDRFNELDQHYQTYCGELINGYGEIIKIQPKSVNARVSRAILFKIVGDYESAITDLEYLIEEDPDDENVLFELLEVYEAYAGSRKSSYAELEFKGADLAFRIEEYDRAIGFSQKILQRDPNNQKAKLTIAQCFHKKGSLDIALRYYQQLEKTQEVLELLYQLADNFYENDQQELALQTLNEIISADIRYKDAAEKSSVLAKELSYSNKLHAIHYNNLSENIKKRFELESVIGKGNMGVVYKAFDNELKEYVALKVLRKELESDEKALESFRSEVIAARHLTHNNIVRIYDIGEEAGKRYISMEYIDGGSLVDFIKSNEKLNLEKIIKLSIDVASALAYAHSQGVLHRDIKPANILLNKNGDIKLSDFGIALTIKEDNETNSNIIAGTPTYMSPEQIKGESTTTASDIYSMGVVMYELLSGNPPFMGENILQQHLSSSPNPIDNISDDVSGIVMKCLEKKPADRYQTADDLIVNLKSINFE